jgi:hypothetical protein
MTVDGWPIDLTQRAAGYQRNPNRSKTPAKVIPKCEYRNPKQVHRVKSQLQNSKRPVWNIEACLNHSVCFGIRVWRFLFLCPWSTSRLCASHHLAPSRAMTALGHADVASQSRRKCPCSCSRTSLLRLERSAAIERLDRFERI